MNIKQLIDKLIESGIEENEAKNEVKILLEHFYNYTEIDKIKGKTIPEAAILSLEKKINERIDLKKPIQYITGKAWFMGDFYKVTPEVLIPRDETEILVQKAIDIINNNTFLDVLDIGTGSGCIACSIAKNTKATVLGIDISTDALRIALDNVTQLGLNNKAIFRKSDLFDNIREGETFDVIISNPPYIPTDTKLEEEVLKEPHIALFAKDNGLYFYKKIIEQAPSYLNEGGYLMFEIGINESLEVKILMEKNFTNINVIKDFNSIDRVIYGKLKN